MTEKFILTSENFEGEIELDYALNGILKAFKNNAELNETQLSWLNKNFPITVELANKLLKGTKLKVTHIPASVTFDMFWEQYNYKVDKALAMKQWDQMKEGERFAAVSAIKAYDNYLRLHPGIAKIYPVRYLKNKRWEVDYGKMRN